MMKFIRERLPKGVGEYCRTQVLCTDKVMAEVLATYHESRRDAKSWAHEIKSVRKHKTKHVCDTRCGAKLLVDESGSGFVILGYTHGGYSGKSAIHELRMGMALREANKEAQKMWSKIGGFTKFPRLRGTFMWPGDKY